MDCRYYDEGRCRSCTLIKTPHLAQVETKQRRLEALVAAARPGDSSHTVWLEPMVSAESGFRSKAKMVVGGTVDDPTVGILDADDRGVDLRLCPLYGTDLARAFPILAEFITVARLEPYDIPARKGELKHIIVTVSPGGELMARFVTRSTESLARLRKHLPWLLDRLPRLVVVTLNVLPEHKAALEGQQEIVLTELDTLRMDMGRVTLHARPQSFLQTNTDIARRLYALVAGWVDEGAATTVWDLYCGVGGFALHCVREGRTIVGVESAEQAVIAARRSAREMADAGQPGALEAAFEAADATAWVRGRPAPDVVIVNPPRRGIGPELAEWIESSGVRRVVYSSCNAVTLAKDLGAMPSLAPVRGRLLDMFPHTEHYEAVVLLERV
ncbi:23S rRNA (uracil(747)-C(5))-methyltransferase RlmC [Demequina lutea]|uniref:23S rRNA (uracil(747)-C(5))-methyltransferase RlmC n=1 Tax=Demequina lutea TaxID=431489 RepID=UPI000782368D|nr:23S rRNA (uracil(747)-C(5))-methyltransferase RlmC [Demequina lutea]